jgi:hypothetical protein
MPEGCHGNMDGEEGNEFNRTMPYVVMFLEKKVEIRHFGGGSSTWNTQERDETYKEPA